MKFIKGAVVGSVVATATAMMLYSDIGKNGRNKIAKKGKQLIKKVGIM